MAAFVIERAAHVAALAAPARAVDAYVRRHGLDQLECEVALGLIERGPAAARIIADGRLFAPLAARVPGLRACARADARFAAVSAASIVAKDLRDRLFLCHAERCGDLAPLAARGMGYINAATRAFIEAFVARHGHLPPETRLSWRWSALAEILGHDPRADLARQSEQLLLGF